MERSAFHVAIKPEKPLVRQTIRSQNMASQVLFFCVLFTLAVGLNATNCPSQFDLVGNKCLYVSSNKVNWFVADLTCRSLGADLLVFEDERDKILTTAHLINLGLPFANGWRDSVWMGINCLAKRRTFVLAKNGEKVPYLKWVPHEPDNADPEEDCVSFANFNGEFGYLDVQCGGPFPFVCEKRGVYF